MTRAHNVIGDGWAGASTPPPNPHALTDNQKQHQIFMFSHFSTRSSWTDQQPDRLTNGRTDKASCRVACPEQKKEEEEKTEQGIRKKKTRPRDVQ